MTAIAQAAQSIRFKTQQPLNRYFDSQVPVLEMRELFEQLPNYVGHSISHES